MSKDMPEGAFFVENSFHYSPPTTIEGLTIEFFMEQAEEAVDKGLTHWATDTDKSEKPWVTTIVFFKPQEKQ